MPLVCNDGWIMYLMLEVKERRSGTGTSTVGGETESGEIEFGRPPDATTQRQCLTYISNTRRAACTQYFEISWEHLRRRNTIVYFHLFDSGLPSP